MKSLKFFLGEMLILAFAALTACNTDNPQQEEEQKYDDAYYAARASISSSDSNFTSTDDGGTIQFQSEGGSVTVNVDCGTAWTVENYDSDLFTATISGSSSLTVTADRNTVEQELTGTVVLVTDSMRISFATINIIQNAYGAPEISAGTNELQIAAAGELTAEVSVEATADWTAESADDWLGVTQTDGGLILTALENGDTSERYTKVTLTCTDGIRTAYDYINVTQDPKAYVILSEETVGFANDASSATVEVEANFDWDVSYDASNGWFSAECDGNNLIVSVLDNNEDGDREGVVTVTAGDGAENIAQAQLAVVQSSSMDDLILVYTTTGSSTTVKLPLYGTVDCTVDWGDGSDVETITSTLPSHSYSVAGEYEVKIRGTVTTLRGYSITSYSKYLTAVKQWGKTGLTSLQYAFYKCTALTEVPADTYGAFSEVTTLSNMFYQCTALASVPDGLFDHCGEVTNLSYLFYKCTALTSIPKGLFDKCTKAENFQDVFCYCELVKEIPEGLFDYCTEATSFYAAFEHCPALESIPENLFKYNTKVTTFKEAFHTCSALTSVPENLFANCPDVTTFYSVFYNCTGLVTLPAGLFAGNKNVTEFDHSFYGCKGLESVPSGLFSNCTQVTTFSYAFYNCSALKSLPENLFVNCKSVTTFSYAFSGCTALTGESAYDVVEVNGEQVKVHLYDRGDYTDYGYTKPATTTKCYTDCTGLSDYSSIPSAWGGGGN